LKTICLQSLYDAITLLSPFLSKVSVKGRGIHELFKDIAKHAKAVNAGVQPSLEQPLLPFAVVRQVWWFAGGTRRDEEVVERIVRAVKYGRHYAAQTPG